MTPAPPPPSLSAQQQQVLDELTSGTPSLSMNELAARCDLTVSRIGLALIALEQQGRARFRGGRWCPARRR